MVQISKVSKFKNNYKYDYARVTLNPKIAEKFFSGADKDKKAIDVLIKYDAEKDQIIIKKLDIDDKDLLDNK